MSGLVADRHARLTVGRLAAGSIGALAVAGWALGEAIVLPIVPAVLLDSV